MKNSKWLAYVLAPLISFAPVLSSFANQEPTKKIAIDNKSSAREVERNTYIYFRLLNKLRFIDDKTYITFQDLLRTWDHTSHPFDKWLEVTQRFADDETQKQISLINRNFPVIPPTLTNEDINYIVKEIGGFHYRLLILPFLFEKDEKRVVLNENWKDILAGLTLMLSHPEKEISKEVFDNLVFSLSMDQMTILDSYVYEEISYKVLSYNLKGIFSEGFSFSKPIAFLLNIGKHPELYSHLVDVLRLSEKDRFKTIAGVLSPLVEKIANINDKKYEECTRTIEKLSSRLKYLVSQFGENALLSGKEALFLDSKYLEWFMDARGPNTGYLDFRDYAKMIMKYAKIMNEEDIKKILKLEKEKNPHSLFSMVKEIFEFLENNNMLNREEFTKRMDLLISTASSKKYVVSKDMIQILSLNPLAKKVLIPKDQGHRWHKIAGILLKLGGKVEELQKRGINHVWRYPVEFLDKLFEEPSGGKTVAFISAYSDERFNNFENGTVYPGVLSFIEGKDLVFMKEVKSVKNFKDAIRELKEMGGVDELFVNAHGSNDAMMLYKEQTDIGVDQIMLIFSYLGGFDDVKKDAKKLKTLVDEVNKKKEELEKSPEKISVFINEMKQKLNNGEHLTEIEKLIFNEFDPRFRIRSSDAKKGEFKGAVRKGGKVILLSCATAKNPDKNITINLSESFGVETCGPAESFGGLRHMGNNLLYIHSSRKERIIEMRCYDPENKAGDLRRKLKQIKPNKIIPKKLKR